MSLPKCAWKAAHGHKTNGMGDDVYDACCNTHHKASRPTAAQKMAHAQTLAKLLLDTPVWETTFAHDVGRRARTKRMHVHL